MTIGIANAFRELGVDVDAGRIKMIGRICLAPTMAIEGVPGHMVVGVMIGGVPPCENHRLLDGEWVFVPHTIHEDTDKQLLGMGASGLLTSGGIYPGSYATQTYPEEK